MSAFASYCLPEINSGAIQHGCNTEIQSSAQLVSNPYATRYECRCVRDK